MASHLLFKICILDMHLDCIQWHRDSDRHDSTCYSGNKALRPCRLAVVQYTENTLCTGNETLQRWDMGYDARKHSGDMATLDKHDAMEFGGVAF